MTSYTNARPGASLLVVPPRRASSWWISTSARGIPTAGGPTPGAPMNESRVRAVQSRRCSKAEGPTPERASLSAPLKPPLCRGVLSIGPYYVGQRLPRSSRLHFEIPRAVNAPLAHWFSRERGRMRGADGFVPGNAGRRNYRHRALCLPPEAGPRLPGVIFFDSFTHHSPRGRRPTGGAYANVPSDKNDTHRPRFVPDPHASSASDRR